jgi:hypothetical protein
LCGAGAKQTKQGLGLSYNQKLGALVRVLGAGARCWSILQPSAKLTSKGLVSCRVLSKDRVGQGLGALCGSILQQSFAILQPKVWCFGAVGGCGAGISYIQALAWCLAWCKEKG